MKDKKFYVYVLLDPRKPGEFKYEGVDCIFEYQPFYVGKGSGQRWMHHYSERSTYQNKIKLHLIRKLNSLDQPRMHIKIYETDDEIAAYSEETRVVAAMGLKIAGTGILANASLGGKSGTLSGELNPNYGTKRSMETRRKISAAHVGKKVPEDQLAKNYRRPFSEERKLNISIAKKGSVLSEETKAKMSAARKGKPKSKQAKVNIIMGRIRYKYHIQEPDGTVIATVLLSKYSQKIGVHKISLTNTILPKDHPNYLDNSRGYKILSKSALPKDWRQLCEYEEDVAEAKEFYSTAD